MGLEIETRICIKACNMYVAIVFPMSRQIIMSRGIREGGQRGAWEQLWNNKSKRDFNTHTQSRFASAVFDGVLGPPCLGRYTATLAYILVSL